MKRIISILLVTALMMTMGTAMAFADEGEISVTVNGQKIEFLQAPVIVDGTTFVPIRAILEALGQKVVWDQATMTATADDAAVAMKTTIKTDSSVVATDQNGVKRTYEMPVKPMITNGTTLVPVREVSEIFAKNVTWDQTAQRVIITNAASEETAKKLDKSKASDAYAMDIVSVQYSTDGTYDCKMAANNDFVLLSDTAEGAGLHTMYFRAENANKDTKISIEKVVEGTVTETTDYKVNVIDPATVAKALSPDKTTEVKVGEYVSAKVSENASTGYSWYITALPAGLQKVSEETAATASSGDIAGAPSDKSFVFKVVDAGAMKLQLTNKRPWEESSKSETVMTYEITATK